MTLTKSSDHNKNHGAHDKCNKIEVSNEKIYGNEKNKKTVMSRGTKNLGLGACEKGAG